MKILLADDHELFLKGLEFIIKEQFPDAEISYAKSYSEIFEIAKNKKDFDLILTDLAMPGSNWLDGINKIHSELPDTPMVVLSAVFDKEIVQKTIDIGVSAYIPKTSSNAVISSAINLVMSGGVYIPPELLKNNDLHAEFDLLGQDAIETTEADKILTPRQVEVLRLMSEGLSNKIIAANLNLTEGTVKLHVTAILKVLNVYNRTGAVVEGKRIGLIK